jgi:uncharacterized protein (DUF2132 family)
VTTTQKNNPLHGLTLAAILEQLVAAYGFDVLAEKIPIRCFAFEPSVASSLKFLRKTPWAREKVESLYLWHLREQKRAARRAGGAVDVAVEDVTAEDEAVVDEAVVDDGTGGPA